MPTQTEPIDNRGLDLDVLKEVMAGTAISTPIVVKPSNENQSTTTAPAKSGGTSTGGSGGAAPATQRGGSQAQPDSNEPAGVRDPAGKGAASDADPEGERDDGEDSLPSLDWTRATEARKQLKTRVKELESELSKLKGRNGSSIDATDYESLKKTKQELEDQVQAIAIERSPKFQAWFNGEYQTIREVAKGISPAHVAQIEKLLDTPSGKQRMADLEKLSEELSSGQVTALNVALMDVDKLNYRKNDIVTKQRESWIAQQRESESQAKAAVEARKKEWEKSFQDVYASAAENLPVYQEREGDEEWNKTVRSNLALARRVFNGDDMTPTDLAKTALWAAAAPTVLRQLLAMQQENAKLMKELEGFKGATPTPRSGASAGSQASPTSGETDGFLDTVLREGSASGFLKTR